MRSITELSRNIINDTSIITKVLKTVTKEI